ncbi:uncharacterized protein LOC133187869 [Saccostrea echinata]|uniref:uncharacterized protein LOC133187869 n=1 Tax=Saccostrea echinata TaxID=191078 RepID=UPI002A83C46A|nr:uncharacterized protein LOC133187869 [Saccostrea echinata]
MQRKRFLMLVLVFLTFGFWLVALVTPGWRISSVMKPYPSVQFMKRLWKKLSTEQGFINDTFYEQFIKGRVEKIQITIFSESIFYLKNCTYERKDGKRTNKCLSNPRSADTTNNTTDYLLISWSEMQIHYAAFIAVLVLCLVSFFFLMKNSGSDRKVLFGGMALFVSVVIELILVIRWIILNINTNKYYHSTENAKLWEERKNIVRLRFPYSILLAAQGLIFSALAVPFTCVLYKKLRQKATNRLQDEENETLIRTD